jgi:hypothetical protein
VLGNIKAMKSILDTKPALGDGEVMPMRQGKAFGTQSKCVLFNRSKADVWKASQSWYDAFVDDPLINYTRAVCFSTFLFPTNAHVFINLGCRTVSSGQQGRIHILIIIMDSRQDGAHH